MTKGETLYEAVIDLDTDMIDEADGYRFKNRRMRLLGAAAAIAACAAVGLAVFAIVSRIKPENPIDDGRIAALNTNTEAPKETALPASDAPTAIPTEAPATPVPTPDLSGKRIVYGEKNYEEYGYGTVSNDLGEYNIDWYLVDEMEKEENSDSLFAVRVFLVSEVSKSISEELEMISYEAHKSINELNMTPRADEFWEAFESWYNAELTKEQIFEYIQAPHFYTPIWFHESNPVFDWFLNYIEENVGFEKAEEYRQLLHEYSELIEMVYVKLPEVLCEQARSEMTRLYDLGYAVDLTSFDNRNFAFTVYMTIDQINAFIPDPHYGYGFALDREPIIGQNYHLDESIYGHFVVIHD